MARDPNGRIGKVTMDPDRDLEVKILMPNGETSSYISIRKLEYVSQGTPAAGSDTRPTVGDRVRLAEGWRSAGDAASGPLRPGDEAIIDEDDGTAQPFHVRPALPSALE